MTDRLNARPNQLFKGVLLLLIILLAFEMRWSTVTLTDLSGTLRADAAQYFGYAYNLAKHGIYAMSLPNPSIDSAALTPDFLRPPGFPLFASLFYSDNLNQFVSNTLYAQLFLNTLVVVLLFWLGFKLAGYWCGLLLSLIYATSPHIINMNLYFLSESLMTSLMVILITAIYIAINSNSKLAWTLVGCVLAYAALTRPYLKYFIVILLPYLAWVYKTGIVKKLIFLLVGFVVVYGPWVAITRFSEGVESASLMVGTLHHGVYPDLKYNDIPESLGYPYRFDPGAEHIGQNMQSVIAEISRRFRSEPGRHLKWFLLGKPLTLWQWSTIQGYKEIYIYYLTGAPWDYLPHFKLSLVLHKISHYPVSILAILFSILVWLPPFCSKVFSRDQQNNLLFCRVLSLMLLYGTLIHMAGAPFPRYHIPQKPIVYTMALACLFYLLPSLLKPKTGAAV